MSADGTIFKPKGGKKWALEISRGKDPVSGRRLRDRTYYDTKAEAQKARVELLHRLHAGTYVAPNSLTVEQFLVQQWLPAKKSQLRRTTWHGYEQVVTRRIAPAIGGVLLQQLTATHLNSFYAHLLQDGRARRMNETQARGLSPATVRQTHTILRKALKDAMRWDIVPRNVADAADPPRPRSGGGRNQQPLSRSQLQHLLTVAKGDRMLALWHLAASTGARRGELSGLRWEHVDLDGRRLTITETLLALGRDVFRDEPKTESSRRTLSLDPATVEVLKAHKARQAAERLAAGPAYVDEVDAVFRHEDGSLIHPDLLLAWFRKLLRRAELPAIRLHDLRHSYATLGLGENVHPKLMAQRLGHSSVAVTMSTYSHVEDRMDRETADHLGGLISGNGYGMATEGPRGAG